MMFGSAATALGHGLAAGAAWVVGVADGHGAGEDDAAGAAIAGAIIIKTKMEAASSVVITFVFTTTGQERIVYTVVFIAVPLVWP
jgi:hypothetical protein